MKRPFDEITSGYLQSQIPAAHPASQLFHPTITITREAGAGGLTLARLLVEQLRNTLPDPERPWGLYESNIVREVLKDHALPQQLADFMQEQGIHRVEDAVEDLLGLHPSHELLAQYTAETIFKLARRGNVVLVGRGAHVISSPLANAFHVMLVAPLEDRIARVQVFYKLTHREAKRFVLRVGRARRQYIRQHFQSASDDPTAFHLTINTGRIPLTEGANLIAKAIYRLCRAQGRPVLSPTEIKTAA